jgi:hypothetical protein
VVSAKYIDPWNLEFVVSNIIANNQLEMIDMLRCV